jgi:hypothetical protein
MVIVATQGVNPEVTLTGAVDAAANQGQSTNAQTRILGLVGRQTNLTRGIKTLLQVVCGVRP